MEEYRIEGPYHYNGKANYCIERKTKNEKWRFVIGGLSYSQAKNYLDNPKTLKADAKFLKISGLSLLLFGIMLLLIYLFY